MLERDANFQFWLNVQPVHLEYDSVNNPEHLKMPCFIWHKWKQAWGIEVQYIQYVVLLITWAADENVYPVGLGQYNDSRYKESDAIVSRFSLK